nr:membrane-spanning 4-domains subfamily A member 12-like isoform X3 [Labrus bergylta]
MRKLQVKTLSAHLNDLLISNYHTWTNYHNLFSHPGSINHTWTMSSSVPASAGGVQVVTLEDSQQVNVMQTFSRMSPLTLGVVQIMIGMMVILFGIPMAMDGFPLLVVYSGTFVWGALLYIITGSITVAVWKFSSIYLVKTALSLNISSAITSFIMAVLLSVDASRTSGLVEGFFGVLVVFHFLQLAVSLTVIVFASLATCECTCKEQMQS